MYKNTDSERYTDELEKTLESIINKSSLDNETCDVLKKLFKNLALYDEEKREDLYSEIINKIYSFEHSSKKPERIITSLVKNDVLTKLHSFFPVADISEMPEIIDDVYAGENKRDFVGVFFRSSYERFIELTKNSNENYPVEIVFESGKIIQTYCKFQVNDIFVQMEKYLRMAAEQYDFDFPLIYSPYARRFAEIIFTDELPKGLKIKNLRFGSLEEEIAATTIEKTLVWNLNLKTESIPSNDINPLILERLSSDDEFYSNKYIIPGEEYMFGKEYSAKENEYILFNGINSNRLGISRNIKNQKLYVIYDGSVIAEHFMKITVEKPKNSEMEMLEEYFENYYSPGVFRKQRLRTNADINYALSGFRNSGSGTSTDGLIFPAFQKKQVKKISEYHNEHRYYPRYSFLNLSSGTSQAIPSKNKDECMILFGNNGVFSEDYARYVLAFMNEFYTEFHWTGGQMP